MAGLSKTLEFIIDTASGDHPFDLYLSLLKTGGVPALVGYPGEEIKLSPLRLLMGEHSLNKHSSSLLYLPIRSLFWHIRYDDLFCILKSIHTYGFRHEDRLPDFSQRDKMNPTDAWILRRARDISQGQSHSHSIRE